MRHKAINTRLIGLNTIYATTPPAALPASMDWTRPSSIKGPRMRPSTIGAGWNFSLPEMYPTIPKMNMIQMSRILLRMA